MPSSSLVKVEVEVGVEVDVEVGVGVGVEVEVGVEDGVGGVRVGVRYRLDQFRYSLDSVKILFRLGVGFPPKNKTNLSQSFSLS